jgi:hypothetical protein
VATSKNHRDKKSWEGGNSEDDWDVEATCAVVTIEEDEETEEKPGVALNAVSKSEKINYDSDGSSTLVAQTI